MKVPFQKGVAVEFADKTTEGKDIADTASLEALRETLQEAIDGKIGFDGEIEVTVSSGSIYTISNPKAAGMFKLLIAGKGVGFIVTRLQYGGSYIGCYGFGTFQETNSTISGGTGISSDTITLSLTSIPTQSIGFEGEVIIRTDITGHTGHMGIPLSSLSSLSIGQYKLINSERNAVGVLFVSTQGSGAKTYFAYYQQGSTKMTSFYYCNYNETLTDFIFDEHQSYSGTKLYKHEVKLNSNVIATAISTNSEPFEFQDSAGSNATELKTYAGGIIDLKIVDKTWISGGLDAINVEGILKSYSGKYRFMYPALNNGSFVLTNALGTSNAANLTDTVTAL